MRQYRKLLITTAILFSASSGSTEEQWTLRKSSHDISVYTRDVKDSPINAVRAEANFAASADTIARLLLAIDNRGDWDSMCQQATLLDQPSPDSRRIHLLYDMPWPVADRDMVMETQVIHDEERIRITSMAIKSDEPAPAKNVVRVTHAHEDWLIEPMTDGTTQVTAIIFLDPAGPIPAWLINLLSVTQPYNVMSKLQELSSSQTSKDNQP